MHYLSASSLCFFLPSFLPELILLALLIIPLELGSALREGATL